jgi:hypothetical protein
MPEEIKNLYDAYEFPQNFEPKFSNTHIISHSPREFFLTFGVGHPPRQKLTPVVQIALTKEHLMELILNLQSQVKKFNEEQGGDKSKPTPPSRF